MQTVAVIEDRTNVAELLVERLRESPTVGVCLRLFHQESGSGGKPVDAFPSLFRDQDVDIVVYSPPFLSKKDTIADVTDAAKVFDACIRAKRIKKLILLS